MNRILEKIENRKKTLDSIALIKQAWHEKQQIIANTLTDIFNKTNQENCFEINLLNNGDNYDGLSVIDKNFYYISFLLCNNGLVKITINMGKEKTEELQNIEDVTQTLIIDRVCDFLDNVIIFEENDNNPARI